MIVGMTNTQLTDLLDTLHVGMHIQLANGSIHQLTAVDIVRTPKRRLLRVARVRSEVTRDWVNLMDEDWRIIHPAPGVTRGAHNCVDGLHHSQSCTCVMTTVLELSDGWSKHCRRCGFVVRGYSSREAAEAAYVADQFGALR